MSNALPNAQIAQEAAEWAVRLDYGPLDPSERKQLAEWLKTSPVHVGELLQSCALLTGAGMVSPDETRSIDSLLAELAPEPIPLFGDDPRSDRAANDEPALPVGGGAARRPRALAIAASVAAVLALGLTIAVGSQREQPGAASSSASLAATQVTAVGEQRSVALEDGSVVSMNADSRLQLAFTERGRQVHLLRGEALFDVAHDPARPFRVVAPGVIVQAVGTQFVVKELSDGVRVVVLEGKVLLDIEDGSDGEAGYGRDSARFLSGGQQATFHPGKGLSPIIPANIAAATSWRSRQLYFQDEPLAMIAREFNRYNRTKVEIRDPDLAAARFSGVFDADDLESLTAFLELSAGVEVDRSEPGKVILDAQ